MFALAALVLQIIWFIVKTTIKVLVKLRLVFVVVTAVILVVIAPEWTRANMVAAGAMMTAEITITLSLWVIAIIKFIQKMRYEYLMEKEQREYYKAIKERMRGRKFA